MKKLKTIERVLSKAGLGSRTEARSWIGAGRVRVNGKAIRDPDHWVDMDLDRVSFDHVAECDDLFTGYAGKVRGSAIADADHRQANLGLLFLRREGTNQRQASHTRRSGGQKTTTMELHRSPGGLLARRASEGE